jgi:hypothetical protein
MNPKAPRVGTENHGTVYRYQRVALSSFLRASGRFYATFFLSTISRSTVLLSTVLLGGCELLPREGDTEGIQLAARWEWAGRLVADTDPVLTIIRLRIDTTGSRERHDVLLTRFDFDPAYGDGDEYSLTVGLDLGRAWDLRTGEPLPIGSGPGDLPVLATVTCLCEPLRADSVRGTFTIEQRGLRQIAARIDARLYFTAWNDSTRHAEYLLRQKLFGVK